SPGAYLWRVATGARFICSREMAYVLQHHLPVGTGYGFHPPVPTDIKIDDDTVFDLAGVKVAALRLPGHTFGSMGWLFERDGKRYVAIGDLIMPDGVLGYAGSINFSPYQVLASLRKLDDLKVDFILPGHGPVVGPDRYVGAGISVGRNVGWGKMKPEAPNPRFRLTAPNVRVVGFLSEATSADFGDLDGDGAPDVVLVTPRDMGSVVKVFLNRRDGDEIFDPMKPDFEIPVAEISGPTKLRLRELNGDNRLDIFIAGQSMTALLLSNGKPREYDVRLASGQEVHQIRLLDIAGDGKRVPVILGRFSGAQVVTPGPQGNQWRTETLKPELRAPYLDVRELDVNGDGRSDWIVNDGRVWLRGENGRIEEQPSLRIPLPAAEAWCYVGIGDFNGDRRPDVAMVSYGAQNRQITHVHHNTGDRQKPFAESPNAVLEVKAQFSHVRDAPPVADWNGDGIDDLVVGLGQDKQVRIYLGAVEGLSAERVELITLEYRLHYEHGLSIADFNADGRPDLACFGYAETGVGQGGPPAGYLWLQEAK
ncbi:MAG TPA: FG-GAP-like repeat-containing protein, partial [Planctomycetaceae bacterium]|nr:FG-GAP-like repeat-containing protein [Planctomycetaceae bacterium]